MVTIIFESHGTTFDNEDGLSSGWYDVELSDLGKKQSKELGDRYKDENFDAIFVSDLKRSYHTAERAFKDRNFKIIKDKRLRECDYGDLQRHPKKEVEPIRKQHIEKPFPSGQGYTECAENMKEFLEEILQNYKQKKIMIIGHRATQYGLEHLINNVPLEKAVTAPWQWQPGWEYKIDKI